MSSDSIDLSELTSSNPPAVKFERIGDKVVGKIVRAWRRQQRDYDTGQPMTWPDDQPRMEMCVVLLTQADGEVTLYARGGRYENIAEGEGLAMENAIAEAAAEAGAKKIAPDDELAVVHSGLSKPTNPRYNGAKLYMAKYKLAPKQQTSVAVDDDLFS